MEQKVITKGEKAGEQAHETKTLEINVKGPYKKYDVCEELGLDPLLLGKSTDELRKFLVPKVWNIGEKFLNPETLNEK